MEYTPDNLIAGDKSIDTIEITIVKNVVVKKGDVLGRVTTNIPITGTAGGSNTGNGTLTGVEGRRYTTKGNYVVTCKEVVANGGVFSVESPDELALQDAIVGVNYDNENIAFVINDGSTDYVVGDNFIIAVVVGSRECKIVDSSNSDGSQIAYCIAAEDVDTTTSGFDAATVSVGYRSGQFNERALNVGGADNIIDYVDKLRELGIFTDSAVKA